MKNNTPHIRVLYLITLLDRLGGAEKNLCDIVLNLNRKRFTPYVVVFKGGDVSSYLAERGIAVIENGVTKLISLHSLVKAWELYRLFRREHIDVVVTYHHDADIFGSIVGALTGVPVISSRRDMGYQLTKKHIWFYRRFGSLFSHFITVSNAVKNKIMRREGISAEKITTIYNGIDSDLFNHDDFVKKQALRSELGLSSDMMTIGMVASFRPIKGQHYLVEAIESMKEWHGKIQIVVIGYNDTDYFRTVTRKINNAGLERQFFFPGARDDIPDLLSLFDIFVISSVNEGFSNAIIEAMAAGIPVVAADSGGNREAVVHDQTGLLFHPCDSVALAKALTTLLNNKSLLKKFAKAGKKRVQEKFTLDKMIAANEIVYQKNWQEL